MSHLEMLGDSLSGESLGSSESKGDFAPCQDAGMLGEEVMSRAPMLNFSLPGV